MTDRTPLGETMRQQRDILNITVRELARRANVSENYIWRIEHGHRQPGRDVCVRLGQALEMDPVVVLRLAGYIPEDEVAQHLPSNEVRKAILRDPRLNDEQKRALLATYHTFVPDSSL